MISKEDYKYLKRNNLNKTFQILTEANWMPTMFKLSHLTQLAKYKYGRKLFYKYMKTRFFLKRKVSIPFITYITTTHCTLNCKHCCHYMPYYTPKTHHPIVTFEQFKNDLDSLLRAIDVIYCLQISGGEPLLCKDLPQIIKYISTKKQIKHFFITTNCTIIPSQELIDSFKETNITVQISDYRNVTSNCYYNDIKKLLQKNNIKICAWEEDTDTKFRSIPDIYYDNSTSPTNLEIRYKECWDSRCVMICDGKIFACPTALHIHSNIASSNEYVDLRNSTKNTRLELIKFYCKPYFEACKYCHRENIIYGLPVGEQEDRNINKKEEILCKH